MIEWKEVDPDKPPEGEKIFLCDSSVYSGWLIRSEGRVLKDDAGYPLWETSENLLGKCHFVRFYADFNLPNEVDVYIKKDT